MENCNDKGSSIGLIKLTGAVKFISEYKFEFEAHPCSVHFQYSKNTTNALRQTTEVIPIPVQTHVFANMSK